jgi:hypothetical protein
VLETKTGEYTDLMFATKAALPATTIFGEA